MYKAYLNNSIFFNTDSDDEALELTSASVTFEAGSAGSFTFTVPPWNSMYGSFKQLTGYVDLYRDSELIFSGRVYKEEKDFQNMHKITCEGMLAVLNDTIFRPTEYGGNLQKLITTLLSNHNSQVETTRRIQVGKIYVTCNSLQKSFEDYDTTMSCFQDIVDDYGGYLEVNKRNGTLYLDYIKEYTTKATQTIELGKNLTGLTQKSDSDDIVTALIPIGGQVESASDSSKKETLTIKSVNGGNDYIQNDTGIKNYGRITATKKWNDIKTASELLTAAKEYLETAAAAKVEINATAVDLSSTDENLAPFKVGQQIYVKSDIHGIARYITCKKQTIDLLNPAKNSITLGDTITGYVGRAK